MARSKHIGSSFDSYLVEQGLHDEVTAVAMKRVIAWQISEAMKQSGITKVAMATRMQTSRSLLDRLLDANDAGLTLDTLSRAAAALDLRIRLELRPASRKPALRRGARTQRNA